jgi:uncharacterized protein YxjI
VERISVLIVGLVFLFDLDRIVHINLDPIHTAANSFAPIVWRSRGQGEKRGALPGPSAQPCLISCAPPVWLSLFADIFCRQIWNQTCFHFFGCENWIFAKEMTMRQTSKEYSFKGTTRGVGLAFAGLYVVLATGCMTVRHDIRDLPPFSPEEPLKTYEMRQRAWTLGDQFVIEDECRRPVFYVKGRAFSVGDKLSFQDADGNELAYISQKVLSLRRNYRIYRRGNMFARVVKKLTPFRQHFVVAVPGADNYRVRGNFWNYEYTFTRGGRKVAVVSKRLFAWPDAYRIAITAGEDDVLILATAVAIDLIAHKNPDAAILLPWVCNH